MINRSRVERERLQRDVVVRVRMKFGECAEPRRLETPALAQSNSNPYPPIGQNRNSAAQDRAALRDIPFSSFESKTLAP